VAEPQVDLAIAYEEQHAAAMAGMPGHVEDAEGSGPVSRETQKGAGLLIALTLYGAAVGGIFALVFAASYGRIGAIGPRTLALLLAIGAFIAVALVPALKYPPNPPAVGEHGSVAFRTLAYFAMIALSLVSLVLSVRTARGFAPKIGAFNTMLAAAGLYTVAMIVVQFVLPTIQEVPADFPAPLLWEFRLSALGMQAILWSAIGVFFGWSADRLLRAGQR